MACWIFTQCLVSAKTRCNNQFWAIKKIKTGRKHCKLRCPRFLCTFFSIMNSWKSVGRQGGVCTHGRLLDVRANFSKNKATYYLIIHWNICFSDFELCRLGEQCKTYQKKQLHQSFKLMLGELIRRSGGEWHFFLWKKIGLPTEKSFESGNFRY